MLNLYLQSDYEPDKFYAIGQVADEKEAIAFLEHPHASPSWAVLPENVAMDYEYEDLLVVAHDPEFDTLQFTLAPYMELDERKLYVANNCDQEFDKITFTNIPVGTFTQPMKFLVAYAGEYIRVGVVYHIPKDNHVGLGGQRYFRTYTTDNKSYVAHLGH